MVFPWIFPNVAGPEDHGCHGHDASPQIVIVPAGSATEAVRRRRGHISAAKWGFHTKHGENPWENTWEIIWKYMVNQYVLVGGN